MRVPCLFIMVSPTDLLRDLMISSRTGPLPMPRSSSSRASPTTPTFNNASPRTEWILRFLNPGISVKNTLTARQLLHQQSLRTATPAMSYLLYLRLKIEFARVEAASACSFQARSSSTVTSSVSAHAAPLTRYSTGVNAVDSSLSTVIPPLESKASAQKSISRRTTVGFRMSFTELSISVLLRKAMALREKF